MHSGSDPFQNAQNKIADYTMYIWHLTMYIWYLKIYFLALWMMYLVIVASEEERLGLKSGDLPYQYHCIHR